MKLEEVMQKLEQLGSEQTKKIYLNQGASEPLFGVKIGDLKSLVKVVRKDQELARALFETGNSDAMYLAGLTVNPKHISREMLQAWVKEARWYLLAEFTVANVAAESDYALDLAREWMNSPEEMVATCGWSTYTNFISITPDEHLDLEEIRKLLQQVEESIHHERNRVRYEMNAFVISVGSYIPSLTAEAKRVGAIIGKVHVDIGRSACKVPLAEEYIVKVESMGRTGTKRKTCIC